MKNYEKYIINKVNCSQIMINNMFLPNLARQCSGQTEISENNENFLINRL